MKGIEKDKPDVEAGRRGVKLDRKIRDRMKEKPRLRYSEAMKEILAEDASGELHKEYMDEQIAAAHEISGRGAGDIILKFMVQQ